MSSQEFRPFAGSEVKVTLTFTNEDGALEDPSDVRVKVRNPAGGLTTYNTADLLNPSVGVWTVEFNASTAGRWVVKGEGLGSGPIVVDQAAFIVEATII